MIIGRARVPLRRRAGYVYLEFTHLIDFILYEVGWRRNRASVPHYTKRRVIRQFASPHRLPVFVETGTYMGDMLSAMAGHFEELYSIELDNTLHAKAALRFAHRGNITLLAGNSAECLEHIVTGLGRDGLFWLDAHYSGEGTARGATDTPIVRELEVVLTDRQRHHVILIDDARCFDGTNGYPTIESVRKLVRTLRPEYDVSVDDDVIRLVPPRP